MRGPRGVLGLCALVAAALPVGARAQPAEPNEAQPGVAFEEAPDPTRLDVERLPPEAAHIARELYARGLFAEAQLGVEAFLTGVGEVSAPGPRIGALLGYELTGWLALAAHVEASIHQTTNHAPPSTTVYENLLAMVTLRLSAPLTAQAALWLAGQAGGVRSTGDVLRTLGYPDADGWTLVYGGDVGFDWHVWGLHHAIGLHAGARVYPGLSDNSLSLAVHGGPYLHYSF